jgi:uncharacterized protein (DUF983 family)
MNVLEQLAESFRKMIKKEPPASYSAAGKPVVCGHCGSGTFSRQRVLVRGPLSHCLVCTSCGLAMWFETAPAVAASEPYRC